MATQIEIKSIEWTIEAMAKDWREDESLTPAAAADAAATQYAYLVNHTGERLPGWSFTGGVFSGPMCDEVTGAIRALLVESIDHVAELLDEIKAEADA